MEKKGGGSLRARSRRLGSSRERYSRSPWRNFFRKVVFPTWRAPVTIRTGNYPEADTTKGSIVRKTYMRRFRSRLSVKIAFTMQFLRIYFECQILKGESLSSGPHFPGKLMGPDQACPRFGSPLQAMDFRIVLILEESRGPADLPGNRPPGFYSIRCGKESA